VKKLFLFVLLLFASGCATAPRIKSTGIEKPLEEKLTWSSHKERPSWTINEPYSEGEFLLFVGLSDKLDTEKKSRDNALSSAITNVVKFIGTDTKSRFERIQTAHGLSTDILDPTITTQKLEDQLSKALTRQIKARDWYLEKWKAKYRSYSEDYFLVYALCLVPKAEIDKIIQEQIVYQQKVGTAAEAANKKLVEINSSLLETKQKKISEYTERISALNQVLKPAIELKTEVDAYEELAPISKKVEAVINELQSGIEKARERYKKTVAINLTSQDLGSDAVKVTITELASKLAEKGYEAVIVESTETNQLRNKASKLIIGTLSAEYMGNRIELPGGKVMKSLEQTRATIEVKVIDVETDTAVTSKNVSEKDFGKSLSESKEKALKKAAGSTAEYISNQLK